MSAFKTFPNWKKPTLQQVALGQVVQCGNDISHITWKAYTYCNLEIDLLWCSGARLEISLLGQYVLDRKLCQASQDMIWKAICNPDYVNKLNSSDNLTCALARIVRIFNEFSWL